MILKMRYSCLNPALKDADTDDITIFPKLGIVAVGVVEKLFNPVD